MGLKSLEDLERKYERRALDYSLQGRVGNSLKKTKTAGCSRGRSWAWIAGWIPILSWLPKYKWRSYILRDLMAGLTVGIVNVPQGMAYGLLAGLDPVYGLYTSMFFPFIYTFFGTSRHAAVGTFAVTSIMTADVLDGMVGGGSGNNQSIAESGAEEFWCGIHSLPQKNSHQMEEKVELAITLTLMIAVIHILFGILKFGFLTVLLSDQLIQGLTTGAAFHVITSQVKYVFGLDPEFANYVRDRPELLPLLRFYGCFFMKISGGFNWEPFVLSIACVAILIVVKLYIDPKTRPRIKFPIPIELILVIITTILAWQLSLNQHNISTVSNIPKGFPSPRIPSLNRFSELLPSAFSIAVMLYAVEVSIAKLFAEKYKYDVDPNQEWIGLGLAHLFGSFFLCHPGGASMSRSMVQGSQGGKSQLVNMVNAIIILVVLLAVADVFRFLPKCTLSAIILVSLKGLFLQFEHLPSIFRRSKTDFLVWIVTFAGVIFFNVTIGLILGTAFSILTIIYRMLWVPSVELSRVPHSHIYVENGSFSVLKAEERIKVFRFKAPLSYLNVEEFKKRLYQTTGVDPLKIKQIQSKRPANRVYTTPVNGTNGSIKIENENPLEAVEIQLRGVVIDASHFTFLDIMACEGLQSVYKHYHDIGIHVGFVNFSGECLQILEQMGFFDVVPKSQIYFDYLAATSGLEALESKTQTTENTTF